MNRKVYWLVQALCALLLAQGQAFGGTDTNYGQYLSVPEMERVCRCKVAKMVTHSENAELPGDLNFVDAEGKKILSIRFETADWFAHYKTAVQNNVVSEVKSVGDEAFQGPVRSRGIPNVLTVRKGGHCIKLCAGTTDSRYENRLTMEQLIALGKLIVSRL